MNVITYFNELVPKNFNKYLKSYFLNNFYKERIDSFDYIQKEISYL